MELHQQALTLRKKLLGENHPDYATSLGNLARVYFDMGNYPKALELYRQASTCARNSWARTTPTTPSSLGNLANLYLAIGDYPKALEIHQQALNLRKKLSGENHPDYATRLTA